MPSIPKPLFRDPMVAASCAMALTVGFWVMVAMPSVRAQCGWNWQEPKSHFDGVDYQGYVFLIEKLAAIELPEDGKIEAVRMPLWATFSSRDLPPSPYLGAGWSIPFLELRIVQIDERLFKMERPDGYFTLLGRDPRDPNLLGGPDNWKAAIDGETIKVSAPVPIPSTRGG